MALAAVRAVTSLPLQRWPGRAVRFPTSSTRPELPSAHRPAPRRTARLTTAWCVPSPQAPSRLSLATSLAKACCQWRTDHVILSNKHCHPERSKPPTKWGGLRSRRIPALGLTRNSTPHLIGQPAVPRAASQPRPLFRRKVTQFVRTAGFSDL